MCCCNDIVYIKCNYNLLFGIVFFLLKEVFFNKVSVCVFGINVFEI